jgi:hypothetical protein
LQPTDIHVELAKAMVEKDNGTARSPYTATRGPAPTNAAEDAAAGETALLGTESPAGGALEPCTMGCPLSLVLWPQVRHWDWRSHKTTLDFCFDGLSEKQVHCPCATRPSSRATAWSRAACWARASFCWAPSCSSECRIPSWGHDSTCP